jgi:hypothetical protein
VPSRTLSAKVGYRTFGVVVSLRRLAIAATLIASSALITWTALGRWKIPEIGPRQLDYYNLLVSGFRKGSLALDIPVPDALKVLKNPWNPAELPQGVGVPHDVS